MERTRWFLVGPFLTALALSAEAPRILPQSAGREARGQLPIQDWPQAPRAAAKAMIEKYGPPDHADVYALSWDENGPWRKTVVYRVSLDRDPESAGQDYLEQTVSYRVPMDREADLLRFSGRLRVDQVSGELSAASASEAENFLALNLADEVVARRRSPAQARDFYARTLLLAQAGKSSPYLDRFLFRVGPSGFFTPRDSWPGFSP